MSGTNHSPGPWHASGMSAEGEWKLTNGLLVLEATGCSGDDDTDIANARLIAAAPAMLAALEMVAHWFGQPVALPDEATIDAVVAAIAKARGLEVV